MQSTEVSCMPFIKAYNGELLVSIDEKVFELRELAKNKSFSENFNEVDNIPKSKAHIPDMQHPWKIAEFRKQQRRARLQHLYA